MKWTILCAAALTASLAGAAPSARTVIEKSPDVLRPEQLKRSAKTPNPMQAFALAPTALAAVAPTDAEVGDADSFGKAVLYLGLGQTMPIILTDDCTGTDPTTERCIVQ